MLLLDTHVWWWSVSEPERLSKTAIQKIRLARPSQRAIASISLWELAMRNFSKTPGNRRNDEKAWIPTYVGMT